MTIKLELQDKEIGGCGDVSHLRKYEQIEWDAGFETRE
jgi:hypothetical protein